VTVKAVQVSKHYGSVRALDRVSFELNNGITGLLGPNGAGKTTLLRCAATVLAPTSGSLEILGLDPTVSTQRTEIRRRIGYLPQEPGFYSHFTSFDFIDYIAILKEHTDRQERHAEVRRVLDLVGLSAQATTKIRKLSGGMRRRLALAQAFLGAPRLLLLDEPTTGLDPEQRASLRTVLSEGAASILLATHQTDDVEALCDRVIVLDEGRVHFDGPVSELVATAEGAVWLADEPDPRALARWKTGNGRYRHVGRDHIGTELVQPNLEDAYLLTRGVGIKTEVQK